MKATKIKLSEVAKLIDGRLAGPDGIFDGFNSLDQAQRNEVSFILDEKHAAAKNIRAGALIAPENYSNASLPVIGVKDPRLALAIVLEHYYPEPKLQAGIDKSALKGENTAIGSGASIGAYVTIGDNSKIGKNSQLYPGVRIGNNCEIGEDCVIFSNAVIYDRTVIGNRVRIHAGAIIGVDGYGFARQDKKWRKIPQIGRVVIEDDVEIYANTCVSRGAIGDTLIKRGTKIDNLTHVAHNCQIGEDCAITGLIGFAGSVVMGNRVMVGGMAGFNDHISIGDDSVIIGKSGVTKDFPAGSFISGFPAQEHRTELLQQAALRKVPALLKRVAELEKKAKGN